MALVLVRAGNRKQILAVLEVISTYSGLLSPKTFNQSKDCSYYIIANDEGGKREPVGVIGYRPLNNWSAEQVNTVILPKYRGRGFGRRASTMLTNKLFVELRYGKVFCTVNSGNKVMLAIKEKQGFTQEGLLKNHFGPGRDIYVLAKTADEI